ncbi:NlpC/P60 family protein [Nakamurella leprariae]|uniref:C40 family peptidase n=1 Tax=Nakamurella leprariae TaxID=2803911 RepID=A0A938YEY9_9ACTN|nr:NlpC/P60 family protein [Nakamurella leprariae]MBM9466610.1 C40 family peptidase [Nakamurella leprariae]
MTAVAELSALQPVDVAPAYRSPYSMRFGVPADQRLTGFDRAPWSDPSAQASIPAELWYAQSTRSRWGSWGPPARRYPVPANRFRGRVARERVLSVAAALIGLDYQHHHVPAWSPPVGWPHKPVRSGLRGPGLDCSNFTSFVYSYALGIDLPTGVAAQSEFDGRDPRTRRAAAGESLLLRRITLRGAAPSRRIAVLTATDHDAFVAQLQPADIVYIRSDAGVVSHAVLWLGACGVGPTATPLVLDAGGSGRMDFHRVDIPAGVRIRPYRASGWYARNTVFAHRIIPD